VTPCTIEMLPAIRFASCARNRVGRKSFNSRWFSRPRDFPPGAARRDAQIDIGVALAGARGDDHVHLRQKVALPFTPALSSARPAA
jgi:hypothetical protein